MGPPGAAGAPHGSFFSRPGLGMMMGGLAAGFLGAGLFGMLSGGGLAGGLGGVLSIIGLILQIGLILIVGKLAMSWGQRRPTPAAAYGNSPARGRAPPPQTGFRSGSGFGSGRANPP